MAYPYRGSYVPRDEGYTNNTNRLGGGSAMQGGDSRGLMRRFTTNSLTMLSPIGQQRRQAAGDTQTVSTNPMPVLALAHFDMAKEDGASALSSIGIGGIGSSSGFVLGGIGELKRGVEPFQQLGERSQSGVGQDNSGAVRGGQPPNNDAQSRVGFSMLKDINNPMLFGLTVEYQSNLLNRAPPVSLPSPHHCPSWS